MIKGISGKKPVATENRKHYDTRNTFGLIVKWIIMIIFAASNLFAFYFIISTSFKSLNEVFKNPFAFPVPPKFDSYLLVWSSLKLNINFFNSIIVTFTSLLVLMLITTMGSYVVARVWKNQIVYFFFILGIFIPIQAIVIPIFKIINYINLLDSLWSLIIIYIASSISFSFFVLEGFMKGIPFELEESAYIDGCGRARSFVSIILPMCKPGIMTILTFNFIFIWNDYLFASILIFNSRMKTLTVAIKSMADQFITDYSAICAGIVISFVPVFIMFLVFQEQIIKGMSMGALKG